MWKDTPNEFWEKYASEQAKQGKKKKKNPGCRVCGNSTFISTSYLDVDNKYSLELYK